VNRADIILVEEIGLAVEEFLGIGITAMQSIAPALGL
jgi:predicted hydrolase (HD superfamily)